MTTSVKNGGQSDVVRHLVNHQSCEGAGHDARFHVITGRGQEAYHDSVCDELGLYAGLVDLATLSVINMFVTAAPAADDWLTVHIRPDYVSVARVGQVAIDNRERQRIKPGAKLI